MNWFVVELDSSAYTSLQSGINNTSTSDPTDVSVSSVTAANCSIIFHSSTDDNFALVETKSPMATVAAATTLRFDTVGAPAASGDMRVSYFLVEWNTSSLASVQNGTIALTTTEESDTATISSVVTAKTAIFHQGLNASAASSIYSRNRADLQLTSSTVVTASRSLVGTEPDINVSFSAVEFTNEAVEAGTVSFTSGETSENPTFTQIGSDYAVVGCWGPWGLMWADGTADLDSPDEAVFSTVVSTPPDDVVIARNSASATNEDCDVSYYIVDFTAGDTLIPQQTMSISRRVTMVGY